MDKSIIDFLKNRDNYYLENDSDIEIMDIGEFLPTDLILYEIEEIAISEELSIKSKIENILSSVRIYGANFVYLVIGDKEHVYFYLGISKDLYNDKEINLEMEDLRGILKANIKGNFAASNIKDLASEKINSIYETINNMNYFSKLTGAAGVKEENETFNYIDLLKNVMSGDEFGFMLTVKPLSDDSIWTIENNLSKLYAEMWPLALTLVTESISTTNGNSIANTTGESLTNVYSASMWVQSSLSENKGGSTVTNVSATNGSSETTQGTGNSMARTNGRSEATQINKSKSQTTRSRADEIERNRNNSLNKSITTSESRQEGTNLGEDWSKTIGGSETKIGGYSKSNTTDSSVTQVNSSSEGKTTATTYEYVDQEVKSWIKYMDEVLFPRIDYGKGKGLFNTSALLFSNKNASLKKLENIIKSVFAGNSGNKIPIKAISLSKDSSSTNIYKKFQLPKAKYVKNGYIDNPLARCVLSQYLDEQGNMILGNWISTKELSSIIGIPNKEE